MTHTPDDLLAVRRYLQEATGLAPVALGVQHYQPDGGGYHEGRDLLAAAGRASSDYSVRESGRDRAGLTDAASAIDIDQGWRQGISEFRRVTLALVAACRAGDPRTHDIREIIYSPDGKTVHRYDALGVRTSGDPSHLTHTHISFFRDSEGRRARADNVLGLLAELIEGTSLLQEDGMGRQMLVADATGAVWLVDGLTRTRVADVAGAGNAQSHQEALLGNLGNGGQVARFGTPAAGMDAWGIDVGGRLAALDGAVAELRARPAGAVTLSAADRAELIAGIAAAVGPIAQQAAEAAVRAVLGGLDGAVPPAGG